MFAKNILYETLKNYNRKIISNENAKLIPSSVLVPLILRDEKLFLLLTKRTSEVEHHKSQICFPGGRLDQKDNSLVQTAIRESDEEIGLNPEGVEIIGMLDDLSVPSGYLITPIVAFVQQQKWNLNKLEVESILEFPLSIFFDKSKLRIEKRKRDGKFVDIFYYDVHTEPVWGATGFIIHNLCNVLSQHQNDLI